MTRQVYLAKAKLYWERLLALLRVKPFIGGLEISDLVLRFSRFDGASWHLHGVRLEPGVIEAGKIKNYGEFIAALKALKLQAVGPKNLKSRINTIVSLSSVSIYSQVFSLPIIEGENLDKAIQLNVQMVSPIDIAQAYSGWQKVGEDQRSLRFEILSAFIDRPTVDEVGKALADAGFLPVAIEPRALALARVLKEIGAGFDAAKFYILVSLDNSGMDFLIIRRGQLYFEYFNPWRDIADEKGQIPTAAFEATMTRNLHQVMNFYSQHWSEPISEVILAATALSAETEKIVKENFSLAVRSLELTGGSRIGPEWFVALGCGLRGLRSRRHDREMSLLGIGAEDEFRQEQAINFAGFWRLVMPISLCVLLFVFIISDLFLAQKRNELESRQEFNLSPQQAKENSLLEAQAKEFNRTVALIASVQKSAVVAGDFWTKLSGIMAANGVTVSRVSLQGGRVVLTGQAQSADKVSDFKKALESDAAFGEIDLPLSGIKSESGITTFSMTFAYKP